MRSLSKIERSTTASQSAPHERTITPELNVFIIPMAGATICYDCAPIRMDDACVTMNSSESVPRSMGRWLLWVGLLVAIVWLGTLGQRKLLSPDEGRYAEIP